MKLVYNVINIRQEMLFSNVDERMNNYVSRDTGPYCTNAICCDILLCVTTTGHVIMASEIKSPDLEGHCSGLSRHLIQDQMSAI